jgi:hypothetical protein
VSLLRAGNFTSSLFDSLSILSFERIREQRTALKKEIKRFSMGKRPFVTEQSIGFSRERQVGEPILIGDTIWALAGLGVPVILRKQDYHYVSVGECYLFRVMLPHLCAYCDQESKPWSMITKVIDVW